jgi:predicted transcriptional regulator
MTSAARYLGISSSAIQGYRRGTHPVPAKIAEKAQELVADGPKTKLVRERLFSNREPKTRTK